MDYLISPKNTAVIILAGGLATRLKEKCISFPKSMIYFGGNPFLSYIVSFLIRKQFTSIYILAGYHSKIIVDYFSTFPWNQYRIRVLVYEPEGTGGDLLKSLSQIEEKELMILNGDTIVDFPVEEVFAFHCKSHADATMILTQNRHALNFGAIWVGNDNLVINSKECIIPNWFNNVLHSVVWKGSSTGTIIIKMNVLESYNYLGGNLSLEGELLPYIIQTQKVFAYDNGTRYFYDYGVPERLDYIKSNVDELINVYGDPYTNLSTSTKGNK